MTRSPRDRSILWRSWLALTGVVGVVLAVLSVLSILQHNALLANLIESRLSVIAQSTSSSFRAIVKLGLPISTVRNADEILQRGRILDDEIREIHAFNPSGIIVHSTNEQAPEQVSKQILQTQLLSDDPVWHMETESELVSGYTISNAAGNRVGGLVIIYPKDRFIEKADEVAMRISLAALALLTLLSLISLAALGWKLRGPIRGLSRIDDMVSRYQGIHQTSPSHSDRYKGTQSQQDFFKEAIDELQIRLATADEQYEQASRKIAELSDFIEQQPLPPSGVGNACPVLAPDSSLARVFSRQLTPLIAALVILSVFILGYFSYSEISRSLQPELAARTQLIGTVANRNIQRAVSSGVPLESLVGAESFFDELLSNFPEISYFGVSTGRIIIESGNRQASPFAPARTRKNLPTFPILEGEEQTGYIIVDTDPSYFAGKFRDVLLDLGVVLLVAVLLTFEIMIVMISRTLTGPFNRLQHLANLQSAGDFSSALVVRSRNAVDQLSGILSSRAQQLNQVYAKTMALSAPVVQTSSPLKQLGQQFSLSSSPTRRLQFSYLNDIRLPLFLFAAADELAISFLPIYTRSVENPLTSLDLGLVLSLPLAGYLLAIMLVSPFARPLADRLGHRTLLLLAAAPTIVAHLGLYASTTTIEVILYRTLVGLGYALATLACQDYVLDIARKESRNRAIGSFTGAMFGGIFAGAAIGGILADRLGYSMVFGISAVLVFIAGAIGYFLLPNRATEVPAPATRRDSGKSTLLKPLLNLQFSALVFGIAIPANILLQVFISYLVALQLDAIGASAADIGRVLMTYFIAIALLGPLAPRLYERRLPASLVGFCGALLSAISLAVAATWPAYWAILFAVFGAGVGHALVRVPQVSMAMEISESRLRHIGTNAVLGSLRTLERAGSIFALVALSLLASAMGYPFTIGVVSAWVFIGALVFAAAYFRRDQRRTSNII